MKRRDRSVFLVVALAAAVLGFGIVAYVLSDRAAAPASPGAATTGAPTPAPTPAAAAATTTTDARRAPTGAEGTPFEQIFAADDSTTPTRPEKLSTTVLRIVWRFALAALLAAGLAFRPRRNLSAHQRNLYVAQTQILLAVVASSLMMIVGDNAARAFGIFAAVSLVRFRTNIRDPKEITVLLISLAIGLATGVGRWELAIILTLFVFPLLWLLERRESEEVFRTMELTVKTRNTEATQDMLREIFDRYDMSAEMRQIDPPDEAEPVGSVMYRVSMNMNVSTDEINERILSTDPVNVEGIEWEQKKNTGYVYN